MYKYVHIEIHVNTCMLPNHVHMSMQTKKELRFSVTVSQVYVPPDSPNELLKIQLREPHS